MVEHAAQLLEAAASLLQGRVVYDVAFRAGHVVLVAFLFHYFQIPLAHGAQQSAPVHPAVAQHAIEAVLAHFACHETVKPCLVRLPYRVAHYAEHAQEQYQRQAAYFGVGNFSQLFIVDLQRPLFSPPRGFPRERTQAFGLQRLTAAINKKD